ncbi:putative SPOR domain-containing protein [Azospirillaceae bacterium]
MTTTLLLMILVLAVSSWLGSLLVQIERDIAKARRRVRMVRDREQKIMALTDRMNHEISARQEQAGELERAITGLRGQIDQIKQVLADRGGRIPARLLVLNARRKEGDREWVVTVSNPMLMRIDPNHPLVQEWNQGREYLVFAKTENDARERTLRRFATRPGTVVKAVVPLATGIFPAPEPATPGRTPTSSSR